MNRKQDTSRPKCRSCPWRDPSGACTCPNTQGCINPDYHAPQRPKIGQRLPAAPARALPVGQSEG